MSSPYLSPLKRPTRARGPRGFLALVVALAVAGVGVGVWQIVRERDGTGSARASGLGSGSPARSPSGSPSPTVAPPPGPINTSFPGLTTFRGNATRDYYGEGPLPMNPVVRWRTPSSGGWCGPSTDARGTITWCGTGWTGQPNVLPRKDGKIEVRIGAYDHNYHFLNGRTGQDFRPQLETGDLAKGSATSDADGYPLYYGGSRDNLLRVVAMDRPEPTVLWSVDSESSVPNPVWNSDWDGAPLQVGDYLLEGGENSWFYVIRLHRGYDANHKVTVDPQVVLTVPGFDDQLFADLGDNEVSIENSVAFRDGIAYFGNSGGLIQGWDIRNVLQGGSDARRVFRFWVGDNTDATIVIDQEGDLYVARHKSHNITSRVNPKAATLGSLMKLDPRQANDPVVWSVHAGNDDLLGTPALYRGVVYAESTDGTLIAVNAESGKVVWRFWGLTGPMENSPVPIDGKLLFGDCAGVLHLWDIADPKAKPKKVWELNLGGCIESTPAVWHGWIWVGTRAGAFYGISDAA